MATFVPNTGTLLDGRNTNNGATNTGLSTQIVIKVNNVAVGALQSLQVNQNRPLVRVQEIGTDGTIEIVPSGATTFELSATRIVFDQIRLPEAFSRGFRFINAQRIPFDIEIYDLSNVSTPGAGVVGNQGLITTDLAGIVTMTYKNCWFQSYSTPYAADNYIISETATIWAETAYADIPSERYESLGTRGIQAQTDSTIERSVNGGARRGSMDVTGLLASVFR